MDALRARQHEHDMQCLSCHHRAFMRINRDSGPFRQNPFLAYESVPGLDCSVCHPGPIEPHVGSPRDNRMSTLTIGQCTGCHDSQNSPSFDPVRYARAQECARLLAKQHHKHGGDKR
jgi:hypothetical protein